MKLYHVMIKYPVLSHMIPDSSMVEQEAVNFKVLGSNPSRGAKYARTHFYSSN